MDLGALGHTIVAISSRHADDTNYHINFYKVIEAEPGVYEIFDYKIDAIQIPITTEPLDAQFQYGSFIWTNTDWFGKRTLREVKICNSLEFYDRELQRCRPCPDGNQGSAGFQ